MRVDSVRFGLQRREPALQYSQNLAAPSTGTAENPVSANNCQICSVKNLLHYFGASSTQIENLIHHTLPAEMRENLPAREMPYFTADSGETEVNPAYLREFLNERVFAAQGQSESVQAIQPHDQRKLEQALDDGKPLWVWAREGGKTLGGHPLRNEKNYREGHAYVVLPKAAPTEPRWVIVDSVYGAKTVTKAALLKAMRAHPQALYNVIHHAPDAEKMKLYEDTPPQVSTTEPSHATSGTSASQSVKKASAPKKPSLWQRFKWWNQAKWEGFKAFWKKLAQTVKGWFVQSPKAD